jgi:hypothetical protein
MTKASPGHDGRYTLATLKPPQWGMKGIVSFIRNAFSLPIDPFNFFEDLHSKRRVVSERVFRGGFNLNPAVG